MAEFSPMMQRYLETKEEYKDCIDYDFMMVCMQIIIH